MLVTRKINVISVIFGKPHAANNVKANSATKSQHLNDTSFNELDKRISITKSEDFHKAQAFNVISPLSLLNR
jgi:hypothetical protein